MGDVMKAAAMAAWKTDPTFVSIAKYLYGENVDLDEVLDDVAKMEPGLADVHVPGTSKKRKKAVEDDEVVKFQADRESNGRFKAGGTHALRATAEVAGAGALGLAAGAAAFKTPGLANDAVKGGAAVGRLLRNPATRKIGRSLLKPAVKDVATTALVSGGGLVAGIGAQRNAESAHHDLKHVFKRDDVVGMLAQAVAKNLITPIKAVEVAKDWATWNASHSKGLSDSQKRGGTAALSAVGATAGVGGLAYAAHDAIGAAKMGRKLPGKAKALIPLEIAGLAGEVAATHILHGDAKKKAVIKNLGEHEVTWEGEFSKVDEDKRQVFGWASVTELDGKPVVDLQGDYIAPTEMERAAYDYVLKSRVGGDMHARVDADGKKISKGDSPMHVSDMIESMVFTPEKVAKLGLPEGSLPTGWWVGFKVHDDDTWNLVKSGDRKGFSIHGMGGRTEKRLEDIGKSAVETLIEKAYDHSETIEEYRDNLNILYERTGLEVFKHLDHGISTDPGQAASGGNKTAIGAGIGGAVGANVGTLAGIASGKGENAAKVGAAAGGLAGAAGGAIAGHFTAKRPASLQHLPMPGTKAASFGKAVGTNNRSGGNTGQRQEMYTQHYLQQATQMMAPQVAQHMQQLQQQQWEQQQMEQQMLQQGAQQQNWQTLSQQGPSQQGPAPQPAMSSGPSGPTGPTGY